MSTQNLPVSLLLVHIWIYCQAVAHQFVYGKKTFLVHWAWTWAQVLANCRGITTVGKKQDLLKWVSILHGIVIIISWIYTNICCSVCDYITADLDAKIVDSDGSIHASLLWTQCKTSFNTKCTTSTLPQFPSFNYGCIYAHLVTDSKTIVQNQHCTATATFRAGGMNEAQRGRILPVLWWPSISGWLGFG